MAFTIQLKGGLGNQLFQYAFGKALALKNNHCPEFNCSWYENTPQNLTQRSFLLPLLNIDPLKVSRNTSVSISSAANYLCNLLPFSSLLFDRHPFAFNERIFHRHFSNNRNFTFVGYWQSFRYFNEIRSVLIKEFSPKIPLNEHYSGYALDIASKTSVMIHIRRSDFITLKSASKNHGVISIEYYLNAIKKMGSLVKSPHFFVFSDEIDWAMKNLPNDLPITFIANESSEEGVVHELHLMTQCKHHIIANSSLSWWGAWLSSQDRTVKICPDRWLKKGDVILDDLFPSNWLQMPATLL